MPVKAEGSKPTFYFPFISFYVCVTLLLMYQFSKGESCDLSHPSPYRSCSGFCYECVKVAVVYLWMPFKSAMPSVRQDELYCTQRSSSGCIIHLSKGKMLFLLSALFLLIVPCDAYSNDDGFLYFNCNLKDRGRGLFGKSASSLPFPRWLWITQNVPFDSILQIPEIKLCLSPKYLFWPWQMVSSLVAWNRLFQLSHDSGAKLALISEKGNQLTETKQTPLDLSSNTGVKHKSNH